MATLADIMSTEVCTTAPDTTVTDAAEAMVRGRFGSVVVTQGPMVVGIFTERDVMRAAAAGADLTSSPVSTWMTPDPVTAAPDLDTEDAADLMLSQGFRHLPVEGDDGPVGIVSLRDVLSARIRR